MVEFAFVAPIAFFTMFAVLEFGLMMFDLGTTRFAAEEAAKVVSQAGTNVVSCATLTGCTAIYSGAPGNPNCDADCQAVVAINQTALGTTTLAQVDEIDIEHLQGDGSYTPFSPRQYQAYRLNGQPCSGPPCPGSANYPASGRDTTLGTADYVAVTIIFKYNWVSGIFNQFTKPTFRIDYNVRLEPQKFAS